jgi:hypothetical protein
MEARGKQKERGLEAGGNIVSMKNGGIPEEIKEAGRIEKKTI